MTLIPFMPVLYKKLINYADNLKSSVFTKTLVKPNRHATLAMADLQKMINESKLVFMNTENFHKKNIRGLLYIFHPWME